MYGCVCYDDDDAQYTHSRSVLLRAARKLNAIVIHQNTIKSKEVKRKKKSF